MYTYDLEYDEYIHEMVYDNFYEHIVHKHLQMLSKQHNEVSILHVEFYRDLILVPKTNHHHHQLEISSLIRTILT